MKLSRALFLACVTLLHCAALAQQDIYVNGKGPVLTIGTGLTWGGSGRAAINNNYIFSPQMPQQNVCVYVVNNNPQSAHPFNVAAFQSGDPTLRVYGTGSRYASNPIQSLVTLSVNTLSTVAFFIHIDAAATVSINISGATTNAGSPDTADVYAVQTTSEHCGSVYSNILIQPTISGEGIFVVNTHATFVTGDGSATGRKIYISAIGLSTNTTITTVSGPVFITSGPSGCATNNRVLWAITPNTATGTYPYTIGNGTGILAVTLPGDSLCVDTSNLATAGSVAISISYSQQF